MLGLTLHGALQVLRIDRTGKTSKVYIKRRDLLRKNRLLPRDLRRIDPSLSVVKTSPSINIKDHALLVNLGGIRCGLCVSSHALSVPFQLSCNQKQHPVTGHASSVSLTTLLRTPAAHCAICKHVT